MRGISWKWFFCLLLFAATALSFFDRQALSVVSPLICKEFSMTNETYARVTIAFLISYSIMFFVGGRLCDLLGTRLGLGLSVLFWSLASGVHGLVRGPFELGIARFLLGMGEGACFPGVTKAVVEWFPKNQRARANGLAIGGVSLGAVAAPPLVIGLVTCFGWREVFLLTFLMGLVWTAVWFLLYRKVEQKSTPEPADAISDERKAAAEDETSAAACSGEKSLWRIIWRRDTFGLAAARFLFDPVFYLYMFWIPQYLSTERGLSLAAIGSLTWIPFFALGVSNIVGGACSDRLVSQGRSAVSARKTIMGFAALATMASGLVAFSPNVGVAIALMALLMFAHGFWITNYITLIGDRFASGQVATVVGLTGMAGTIGGIFASPVIGWVADHIGFSPIWLASGCLYPMAFIVVLWTVRGIKNTERKEKIL